MLVWCWLIVISHLKPWSGVFTIADEIPMFVDTVSEFKANKVKNWYSRIHTLKPTQNELEILWGATD
ncbi:sugar kinase YeiI [Escherichia coli]|uniref:Sugar kinase YeiI n=1 Tax=Escherichia coli TaxID=562 RepID=A0A376KRV2_ECOLX|nr:sugar kinase YeiI [Escherichia coli]